MNLYPMTFCEFPEAMGQGNLVRLLESRDSDCEIDFAFGCGAAFVPVEVMAEINLQAKSLMTFCRKQQVSLALRVSMRSFQISNPPAGKDGGTFTLVDLPLYGIEQAYNVCEEIQG